MRSLLESKHLRTNGMQTSKLSWVHGHPAETVYIGWFEDGFMCVIGRSHRTYVALQDDNIVIGADHVL